MLPLHKIRRTKKTSFKNLKTNLLNNRMADKNDMLADKILSSIESDILTGIQTDMAEEEAPLTENYPQPDASYSHKDTLTL